MQGDKIIVEAHHRKAAEAIFQGDKEKEFGCSVPLKIAERGREAPPKAGAPEKAGLGEPLHLRAGGHLRRANKHRPGQFRMKTS